MAAAAADNDSWGLTCRFRVSVDQTDLGGWDTCKGLQVDFGLKEVREGGTNDHSYWLPDQIKYKEITLTRAMTKANSEKVQLWLKRRIDKVEGGTASITLLDGRGDVVLTWVLLGVYPQQWQGPSLTAKDSNVAVETLVLVHEGFLALEVEKIFGGGKRTKATLENKDDHKKVVFDYSPQTMKLQRGTNVRHDMIGGGRGSTLGIWAGATPRILQGKAILTTEGGNVRERAELLLLHWMDAGGATGGTGRTTAGSTQNQKAKPQKLVFTWGNWKPIECTLKQVTVDYVRFSPSGDPLRAEVTFTVNEEPSTAGGKPTNPTSGGLPGRQAHVLTEGENLPLLAARNYGHPGAWRAVANVNGIDDPFRVRSGRTVYLPNANELIGG